MSRFDHIEHWIFDLDNTLYPSSCRLFDQIDKRMTQYVADYLHLPRKEAWQLQKDYYRDYGTTMNGMMINHGMKPDPYLHFVHDIDHSSIAPAPELASAIKALPGRKLVFTNASLSHGERVLERLGLADLFEQIHDIKDSRYIPKPKRETYELMLERTSAAPQKSAMFEDIARNLEVPFAMGMTTVLIKTDGHHCDSCAIDLGTGNEPHVHHATDNLADFLAALSV